MGKSYTADYYFLSGALCGVAWPQVWDNAASSAYTATWTALHTADPGAAGYQGTSEVNYTGYARVSVTRSTAGWSVSTSAGTAKPVSAITFPQATSTSTMTASYFSVGSASVSTAGTIIYSGAISPTIDISQNVTPRLTTSSTITES